MFSRWRAIWLVEYNKTKSLDTFSQKLQIGQRQSTLNISVGWMQEGRKNIFVI